MRRVNPNKVLEAIEQYFATRSIGGGTVDVVDDEDIDGRFDGFELEAELFLDCGEDSGVRGIDGRRSRARRVVGELEAEVVGAAEACAVYDGATERDGEDAG